MNRVQDVDPSGGLDIGAYCRAVEAHLTGINEGQIVRVVGPAFELVRGWALAGVPLSIVFHGMTLKAERHKAGRSARPLRLEFCENDVRAAYEGWRRAVGISRLIADPTGHEAGVAETSRRHPSLTKHLDRVIDRLARVTGRLDLPDAFRGSVDGAIQQLSALRDRAKVMRGPAKGELASALPAVDEVLMASAREACGEDVLARIRGDARSELEPYRARLPPDAWQRSVGLGVDRLMREHLGLPTLVFEP